jgi:hypothetical protein
VQMRTRIMNQLQALAMNEGYRWKELVRICVGCAAKICIAFVLDSPSMI